MSSKRRIVDPIIRPTYVTSRTGNRKVRKQIVVVNNNVSTNLDPGTGSNVQSTILFRCGAVQTIAGAATGNLVESACTTKRLIFNGGAIIAENTVVSTQRLFVVVMRVESSTSVVAGFKGVGAEWLRASASDTEDIVYAGSWPMKPENASGQSTTATYVPINYDMKAKRKLNTGDSIIMFSYTLNIAGTANLDTSLVGVSTIIAD